MADKRTEVQEKIDADAATVYELVADLPNMGRLSPENTGGKWVGGASGPAVGAKFRGNNKAGWRRWSTSVTVTAADPGKKFAFHVSVAGIPIADWTYEFQADGAATTVTEIWEDRRPGWMDAASGVLMGVPDRTSHNNANMAATLTALKNLAESAAK
jgi:hypothetical protein